MAPVGGLDIWLPPQGQGGRETSLGSGLKPPPLVSVLEAEAKGPVRVLSLSFELLGHQPLWLRYQAPEGEA